MVAQRAMEKMMIQDLADQCYRELSGGQQQRVLLARALCAAQKILELNSMQSITSDEIKNGVTYLSVMEDNLKVLKEALK